jgi:hypothetical protein
VARKAIHHFIPRSYLKGFTEGGKDTSQFWGVRKTTNNNHKAFLTSPSDACCKRDYYTVEHENPLVVENWYAEEIEPKLNLALRHIDENKCLPYGNDMQNLFLLAATLFLRTPSFRSTIENPLIQAKEIVDSMNSDVRISNLKDFDYTKTDLIGMEIRQINNVVESLTNKYYRLYINSNSAFDVITSDRPFILTHPKAGNNFYFGLNTPNIEIWLPINRNTILIGRNEPFEKTIFPSNDKLIGSMNIKLILSADQCFYSSKPEIVLVDEDTNVYKSVINSDKASQ